MASNFVAGEEILANVVAAFHFFPAEGQCQFGAKKGTLVSHDIFPPVAEPRRAPAGAAATEDQGPGRRERALHRGQEQQRAGEHGEGRAAGSRG